MAKFFNKESLIDTLYTLHTEAGICDNDYRIWYKLNENAKKGGEVLLIWDLNRTYDTFCHLCHMSAMTYDI